MAEINMGDTVRFLPNSGAGGIKSWAMDPEDDGQDGFSRWIGGLDGLLAAVDVGHVSKPLTPRLAGLLVEHRDLIGRMRVVASARTDVPVNARWERGPVQSEVLADLGSRWGVTRFVDETLAALSAAQTVDE